MELQLPRGVRDFGPAEKLLRDDIVNKLKTLFEVYGFNPIETPIIERWDVLSAKYGGGEEILKETYKLTDQGERELGLRYDLTTPLARFMGMNQSIKRPFKRYHIGTVYRDGPIKKGRYREFYQCDVDTIGTTSMLADAECIQLALDFFASINFDVEIRVNNRELLNHLLKQAQIESKTHEGRLDDPAAKRIEIRIPMDSEFTSYILTLDKLEKIGKEKVIEELNSKGLKKEFADVFFSFVEMDGSSKEKIENLAIQLGGEPKDFEPLRKLNELFNYLDYDSRVRFVPSLARGLGYYTGTVFEVFMTDGTFNSAVAAGGRYDNLISDFLESKDPMPAVGISFGLEPIIELMKDKLGEGGLKKSTVRVYVAAVVPDQTRPAAIGFLKKLRNAGIPSDIDLVGRGPSANFKYANAYDIPYVIVIGPDELDAGVVNLKDMVSGEEEQLSMDAVIDKLSQS